MKTCIVVVMEKRTFIAHMWHIFKHQEKEDPVEALVLAEDCNEKYERARYYLGDQPIRDQLMLVQ